MLIGMGAGFGVFFPGAGIDDDPGVYYWLYLGSWLFPTAGAITGALIDRGIGNDAIYLAPQAPKTSLIVSPWLVSSDRRN